MLYQITAPSGLYIGGVFYTYGTTLTLSEAAAKYHLFEGEVRLVAQGNVPLPDVEPNAAGDDQYIVIRRGQATRLVPLDLFIARMADALGHPFSFTQAANAAKFVTLGLI